MLPHTAGKTDKNYPVQVVFHEKDSKPDDWRDPAEDLQSGPHDDHPDRCTSFGHAGENDLYLTQQIIRKRFSSEGPKDLASPRDAWAVSFLSAIRGPV